MLAKTSIASLFTHANHERRLFSFTFFFTVFSIHCALISNTSCLISMSHSIDSPDNTLAIAWVSDLNPSSFRNPESPSTLSPSSHTSDPSPSKTSRGKRKRSNSGNEEKQEITPSKIPRLTRQALRTIPGNSSMGKNVSFPSLSVAYIAQLARCQ